MAYFALSWLVFSCAVLLAVRFYFLPQIDRFRGLVVERLQIELQHTVTIQGLAGEWDGWNPKIELLGLKVTGSSQETLLELPKADAWISWRSLLTWDLRLRHLVFVQPKLQVRRDHSGAFYLAGMALQPASMQTVDLGWLRWLLRQRVIDIQNAEVTWLDEMRQASPLLLQKLNFRLRNAWGNHQFGFSVLPPDLLAGRLDVRGMLRMGDLSDWRTWRGQLYTSLDRVDLSLWRPWLSFPGNLTAGKGAIRLWLNFSQARLNQATADLAFEEIAVFKSLNTKDSALGVQSEFVLPGLSGRLSWQLRDQLGGGRQAELNARQLRLVMPTGGQIPLFDFQIHQDWQATAESIDAGWWRSITQLAGKIVKKASHKKEEILPAARMIGQGQLKAEEWAVAPLLQLAEYFPLAGTLRDRLLRQSPSGILKKPEVQWSIIALEEEPKEGAIPSGQLQDYAANKTSNSHRPGFWIIDPVLAETFLPWLGFNAMPIKHPIALQWQTARVDLENIGWSVDQMTPGVKKLSGRLEATPGGGRFQVNAPGLELYMPRILLDPVRFNALTGGIAWQYTATNGYHWDFTDVTFKNSDLNGSLSGEYRPLPQGPGWVNLTAKLLKTDVRVVWRYLPLVVSAHTRDWLKTALNKGSVPEAKLKLYGNLADFPFEGKSDGKFEVAATVRDAELLYAEGWPVISRIQGKLLFRGDRMEIAAEEGATAGNSIRETKAIIPSLSAAEPHLRVEGVAQGPLANFLSFIPASPVAGWIDHFTDHMEGKGLAKLGLQLDLPLVGSAAATKVQGEFYLLDNELKVHSDWPTLKAVKGKLVFTEKDIDGEKLTAQFNGGTITADLHSSDRGLKVLAQGMVSLEALNLKDFHPLLSQVQGTTDWRLSALARPHDLDWTVESSLRGVEIGLPPPFAKQSNQVWPLRIARNEGANRTEEFSAQLGAATHFFLERSLLSDARSSAPSRGWLHFGAKPPSLQAEHEGFWITGNLSELSLDQWLNMQQALSVTENVLAPDTSKGAEHASAARLKGVDLTLGSLDIAGKRFKALQIEANRDGAVWSFHLASPTIEGSVRYFPKGRGKVLARLQRFTLPEEAPVELRAIESEETVAEDRGQELPEIDLIAEQFALKDRDLGKLELLAHPNLRLQEWRLDHLNLINSDGTIELSGLQKGVGAKTKTQVKAHLNMTNIGQFLRRFDMPEGVKGGKGLLTGELQWQGPIHDLNYPTLSGQFRLEAQNGQFVKVDPGLGKLLGVLSLQALPKRITLDFKDIFSEGFAFDNILGNVQVQQGILHTQDLKINGSAAKIEIKGTTNLEQETQDITVRVLPSISNLFVVAPVVAINPIVGAAIWAGSKLLNDPFDQAFARNYQITGSWTDPKVDSLTKKTK